MRFRLHTLVDITETRARRGDDPKQVRQHQNYLTVLQTIGLRVNSTYVSAPELLTDTPSKYNLGKSYKGKHNIWRYDFDIEYESALNLEMLTNDFDLVPVIVGLDETAKFKTENFLSQNQDINNIFFEVIDK
jgi:hypothetical protein